MVVTCSTIGTHPSNKLLKDLFDSGSTKTMIHCSALPTKFQCILKPPLLQFQNIGGRTSSNKAMELALSSLSSIAAPLLIHILFICLTKTVDMTLSLVPISLIHSVSPLITIKTLYKGWITRYLSWNLMSFLTPTHSLISTTNYAKIEKTICLSKRSLITMLHKLVDVKYEQVDTNRVATNQKHLNINQCHNLQQALAENGKLCDGSLGVYPHQKVHIDFLPGSKLVHYHTYPVPWVHKQTFKKEL